MRDGGMGDEEEVREVGVGLGEEGEVDEVEGRWGWVEGVMMMMGKGFRVGLGNGVKGLRNGGGESVREMGGFWVRKGVGGGG